MADSLAEEPQRRTPTDWLILAVGTGFFVGMVPPRTATIATMLGIPLAVGLYQLVGWSGYVPVLVLLWLIGIPVCRRSAELLGREDPREVTYDEYSTLPLVYFLVDDFNWQVLAAGFALHRFFDILKPLGVRRLEKLGGGLGIMSDDVLAATYGLLIMRLLDHFSVWPFA